MNIAIITQPLETNYGGLLQNFALQKVLYALGHESITFDQLEIVPPLLTRLKISIRSLITPEDKFQKFVRKNINSTYKARNISDFSRFEKKYKPDAYIVGSDQVWRPKYNRLLDSCFLTFSNSQKKIAYAASFGTDEWEYSVQETQRYTKYISKFVAVGVREKSAVYLCRKYFNIEARQVLDPTLLLRAKDYDSILDTKELSQKYLFTYILDSTEQTRNFVYDFCHINSYIEIAGLRDMNGNLSERLAVEDWLGYLKNASFVICDSFHGTVFSILMHRPFLVLQNSNRGNTRLTSILQSLGLDDRLIFNVFDINNIPNINWEEVDSKLDKMREESIEFLKNALS